MTRAFDRCPNCRGPLRFEGVANRQGWTRWLSCADCGAFVVCDDVGNILEVSGTPPAKGQFRTGRELDERR